MKGWNIFLGKVVDFFLVLNLLKIRIVFLGFIIFVIFFKVCFVLGIMLRIKFVIIILNEKELNVSC